MQGDIDVRGFFGSSDEVRKGFNSVRVVMRVKSEAAAETLRELAMYSAVYDIVANSLPWTWCWRRADPPCQDPATTAAPCVE